MKSRPIRMVFGVFLCLYVLTALSGCSLFNWEKMVNDSMRKNDEKWRELFEEQQRRHLVQQIEQQKIKAEQKAQESGPKQHELPVGQAQEPQNTQPVAQTK